MRLLFTSISHDQQVTRQTRRNTEAGPVRGKRIAHPLWEGHTDVSVQAYSLSDRFLAAIGCNGAIRRANGPRLRLEDHVDARNPTTDRLVPAAGWTTSHRI